MLFHWIFQHKTLTHITFPCAISGCVWYESSICQGRSQTSEQDEGSFERPRREPLEGSGVYLPRHNALLSIFRSGISSSESQSWASVEVHFFVSKRYLCQINDHLHFKTFRCCNTYYSIKWFHESSHVYGFYTVDNKEKTLVRLFWSKFLEDNTESR